MKWPKSIICIRHGQSDYNVLRAIKSRDPKYRAFCEEYERGHSEGLVSMAAGIRRKYALNVDDYKTPLSKEGVWQAEMTGKILQQEILNETRHWTINHWTIKKPDVILVSPYLRTRQTLDGMVTGGFETQGVKVVVEDRLREQEHGLSLLYNDWRVFHAFHPEQRELRELMGPYWYQYPQGESVSMVRSRIRSLTNTLIREYTGAHVMLITHHLAILSIRANYERLTPEQFIHLDENEKPLNCGMTMYRGNPNLGSDGKLELVFYNERLF